MAKAGNWNGHARCMHFLNAKTGYLATHEGEIYKTNDSANTWTLLYSQYSRIDDIFFSDENNGLAVAEHTVYQTSNGGQIWSVHPTFNTLGYRRVFFSDNKNGYITHYDGSVYHTSDGGLSWQNAGIGESSGEVNGISFDSKDFGIAISQSSNSIYKSTNKTTWEKTNLQIKKASLYQVKVMESGDILFFTSSGAYKTDKQLKTYELCGPNVFNFTYYNSNVATLDNDIIFYTYLYSGGSINSYYGKVIYSKDGGAFWTILNDDFLSVDCQTVENKIYLLDFEKILIGTKQ